jgi:hypothetical protein
MLVLLSVSEAFDNSSAHVCTFDGLNVPVVGYQSNGVFCELLLSFSPGVGQVGLANAVSGELLSDTVPFLFEQPLEVAGSVNVARVSRGLQVRVPVKHSSATMDVSCRFGSKLFLALVALCGSVNSVFSLLVCSVFESFMINIHYLKTICTRMIAFIWFQSIPVLDLSLEDYISQFMAVDFLDRQALYAHLAMTIILLL